MDAALYFDLPEDEYEFRVAQDGRKYKGALESFHERLRMRIKHDGDEANLKVLDEIWSMWLEEIQDITLFE